MVYTFIEALWLALSWRHCGLYFYRGTMTCTVMEAMWLELLRRHSGWHCNSSTVSGSLMEELRLTRVMRHCGGIHMLPLCNVSNGYRVFFHLIYYYSVLLKRDCRETSCTYTFTSVICIHMWFLLWFQNYENNYRKPWLWCKNSVVCSKSTQISSR